jgi:hypothetical protein
MPSFLTATRNRPERAVAYGSFHALRALTPLENHGELAILCCFTFLLIAARGSGS